MQALVLPEAPVSEDDRQMPMFPELRDLLEVVRLQARAIEHLTGQPQERVRPNRRHVPQQKEYRAWPSFRAAFRELERVARRERQLRPQDQVTKEMCHEWGGPSPRTITRIMVETYGLGANQWPPSTWPETPPVNP